ncbi:hypothetical protein ACVSQB_32950 [Bradyrhizobium elkanii]
MPSLSEQLFKAAGLTPFGREPGYVAPRPPSPGKIAKLGDALDRAEQAAGHAWDGDAGTYWGSPDTMPVECYYAICDRRHQAEIAYSRAVNARDHYAQVKAEQSKRTPSHERVAELFTAMAYAQHDLDIIEKAGSDFSSVREAIDAKAKAFHTERLYEIALSKYRGAAREARRQGKPFRDRPRSHPVHFDSDGRAFYRTGRYTMRDGVRIPIVEYIQ